MKNPWKALPEGARDLIVVALVAVVATLLLAGCAGLPRTLYDVDPITGDQTPVQEIPYFVGGVEVFSAAPAGPGEAGPGWLGSLLSLAGPWAPLLGLAFPRVRQNLAGAASAALSLKPVAAAKHLAAIPGLVHTPKPAEPPAADGA